MYWLIRREYNESQSIGRTYMKKVMVTYGEMATTETVGLYNALLLTAQFFPDLVGQYAPDYNLNFSFSKT